MPYSMECVAAMFKAAGYHSHANYPSDIKKKHIDVDHEWTQMLVVGCTDMDLPLGATGHRARPPIGSIAIGGSPKVGPW